MDCKSITINGNAIKSISSKDGACIGAATGGSVGSITISDAELPLLSSNKILIGWDADSPGGKLTIRNCHVASTDELTTRTDGIRVGSNSELVIEESEIRLPHFRSIRVGGNGSIAVRDSALHTYGIFMDENAKSPNDAKTLKRLEITDSTVLTGDIIGARGEYSSVEEIVIRSSIIRLNDEYTYNAARLAAAKRLPLAASTFRTAKSIVGLQSTRLSATVHNPNPMVRAVSALRTARCPFAMNCSAPPSARRMVQVEAR